jgi:outer membrane protein OmpA-like peptidoglycan-associated protein
MDMSFETGRRARPAGSASRGAARWGRIVLLVAAAGVTMPPPTQAQLPKRITETVKQRAKDRKAQTEDNLVDRVGSRTDSLLEKGARPLDSLIARTMSGIDSIAVRTYRSLKGSESETERELRDALAEGRVDLDLGFSPGGTELSADGEALIGVLARVLRKSEDDFILEGRYLDGEDKVLARKRALAVMVKLAELEVNGDQLHVVPRAVVAPDRNLGVVPVR